MYVISYNYAYISFDLYKHYINLNKRKLKQILLFTEE